MSDNLSHEEKVSILFNPLKIGDLTLKNRIVMAPMTRSRANELNIQSDIAVTYYEQRATAGLIITEGTQVSQQGVGYINTPGIHTKEQVESWKKVTEAVHNNGGLIFAQLWHVGRVSHPYFHNGELPVAPSAIGYDGQAYTPKGFENTVVPRALENNEIKEIVEQFRQGAINAKEAGFDGVELHGANGYLIDQFLQDSSNQRTDEYGGSVENRARFLLEVANAVISVWGKDRVGVRLSPGGLFNGMGDSNPIETFEYAIKQLNKLPLAYLHLLEPFIPNPKFEKPVYEYFRPHFSGFLIANKGFVFDTAAEIINNKKADLVSFGSLFISNPDLPSRFKNNYPLAQADQNTFYAGGEKGYIDYPIYS